MLPEFFWTSLPFQLSFVYNSRHLSCSKYLKPNSMLVRSYFVLLHFQVQNCLWGKCYFGILYPFTLQPVRTLSRMLNGPILFTWVSQKSNLNDHCIDFVHIIRSMQCTVQGIIHKMFRKCISIVFFLYYCFFHSPEYQFKCKILKCGKMWSMKKWK